MFKTFSNHFADIIWILYSVFGYDLNASMKHLDAIDTDLNVLTIKPVQQKQADKGKQTNKKRKWNFA